MATKEVKKEEPAAEVVAPPKKSKKLLIIVIASVVVILGLGLGLGYVVGHKKAATGDANAEQAAAEKAKKKEEPQKPPVFVALEPFTVNLQPDTAGEQFLQAVVSLRVPDEKKGEELKAYMPQIRHEILSLASAKKASEITTPDGRETLAEDIKDTVNEVLGYDPPRRSRRKKKDDDAADDGAPVMAVYFTQFIVQ
jgi:flagellar FliL protein